MAAIVMRGGLKMTERGVLYCDAALYEDWTAGDVTWMFRSLSE